LGAVPQPSALYMLTLLTTLLYVLPPGISSVIVMFHVLFVAVMFVSKKFVDHHAKVPVISYSAALQHELFTKPP